MWDFCGKPKDAGMFGSFVPAEILIEYDGPRTFTLFDTDGELCLAHWLDEDEGADRFLVVPATERLVERLKRGDVSLLDALDQPRSYVVVQERSGSIRAVWLVGHHDLPTDSLPRQGTMLYRTLEPVLSSPTDNDSNRFDERSVATTEASVK